MLYACPNIGTTHRAVRLNIGTPSFTRAPGEAPGVYALESAMDELAYKLNMDPMELRLRNYAEVEPESGKPFSSKSLRECYRLGAERFGWSKRPPEPRSMRAGRMLVGYGMATATYPTNRSAASARARLMADGTAVVQSGSQDIGTGTYTVMTQVAADAIGLPPERVQFQLGDTDLPPTPASGGSQTAASVGSAVFLAGQALRDKLIQLALGDRDSPLYGAVNPRSRPAMGGIFLKNDGQRGRRLHDLTGTAQLAANGGESRCRARRREEQICDALLWSAFRRGSCRSRIWGKFAWHASSECSARVKY